MPSTCGAFTLARSWSRVRTRGQSAFSAASASGEGADIAETKLPSTKASAAMPNTEGRSPKVIRRPKCEEATSHRSLKIRTSKFGIPSDFGFRISDFTASFSNRQRLEQPVHFPGAVLEFFEPHAGLV